MTAGSLRDASGMYQEAQRRHSDDPGLMKLLLPARKRVDAMKKKNLIPGSI